MQKDDIVIMNGKCYIPAGEDYKLWEVESAGAYSVKLKGKETPYPIKGLTVIFPAEGEC